MRLTSPVFKEGGKIPSLYTCQGKNFNPPLQFHDVPTKTKSLVLIMDDPDVPKSLRADGMYDHWIVFNIAPSILSVGENETIAGIEGKNTNGKNGYIGPCPPDREHRYFFKLYALDKMLDLPSGATKKEVENAMEGHIIEMCQLMGKYEKHR